MFIKLKHISKSYQKKQVLNNINFEVNRGEVVSMIGPSGAGKTTLLKLIAGLEKQDQGQIIYQEKDLKKNPIILVFQDYVLFPHLSLYENVAFGLKIRKLKKDMIREKVMFILSFFQLADKIDNFPNQLSAGQKQRAAIARALVINPSLLLLDEPFANLDKNLKSGTAEFIKKTQQEFGITIISVTHDLEEAFMMSDKIGVLLNGQLCQYDQVNQVYYQPRTYAVARFLGHVNTIPRQLFPLFNIKDNREVIYSRAESIEIKRKKHGFGIVSDICFAGHYILYKVKIEQHLFHVYRVHNDIEIGERVDLTLLNTITTHSD